MKILIPFLVLLALGKALALEPKLSDKSAEGFPAISHDRKTIAMVSDEFTIDDSRKYVLTLFSGGDGNVLKTIEIWNGQANESHTSPQMQKNLSTAREALAGKGLKSFQLIKPDPKCHNCYQTQKLLKVTFKQSDLVIEKKDQVIKKWTAPLKLENIS